MSPSLFEFNVRPNIVHNI